MKKTKTKEDKALDAFFSDFIADQKANGASTEELAANGEALIKQFMKRFYESALQGEMEHHLGYKKGDTPTSTDGNRRNGSSKKKVISDAGEIDIEIPRDRASEFDPSIIPKNERRLPGFNEKVLYLYAQGLSQREIAAQLKDLYHTPHNVTLKIKPHVFSINTALLVKTSHYSQRFHIHFIKASY